MIIFGTKLVNINLLDTPKVTCQDCGEKGYSKMSRFVKYFHLYYVPVLPYSTSGLSQCDYCETIHTYEEMSKETKKYYAEFKERARVPLWTFMGLFGIITFVFWIFLRNYEEKSLTSQYLSEPKTGDVCYIELSPESYTTMRLSKVSGDTLFVNFNTLMTNLESGCSEINRNTNYSTDTSIITSTYLKGMFESKEILKIIR